MMAEAPGEEPTVPPAEASMSEESGSSSLAGCVTGGTWWGGLLQVAKDKSASAIDFVKKDLTEFGHTMQNESGSIAANVRGKLNHETAVAASQKVKYGMNVLFDGIKTALIIPPEDMDEDDVEPITITTGQHIFDRAKARLHAVQIDPGTYCNEPSGSRQDFEAWKNSFELESKKGDISELLVANVQVRALYTQLVPSSVSHADYWQRYFYKLYQLEQEEQRRADLKKRADVVKDDDDLAWDDEDDWDSNVTSDAKLAELSSLEKPEVATSAISVSATTEKTPLGNTDSTQSEQTADIHHGPMGDKSKSTASPATASPDTRIDPGTSPTDTFSASSDASDKDCDKVSSTETLTIVSSESPADIPDDQSKSSTADIRTKEKGDIVVVVDDNNGSDSVSPPTSESNSNNKAETDDDWEKDFDIEVTEEDLKEIAQTSTKELTTDSKEEDDDWENWE